MLKNMMDLGSHSYETFTLDSSTPMGRYCVNYFPSCITEKYMITDSYTKLKNSLNSNPKILLKGPKGAGKTSALLYLAHYYTTKDQTTFPKVVLVSPSWRKNGNKDFLEKYLKEINVELQNLPDRTLFLLDLGKFVAEWDDEMQRLLHVALSDTIAAVIAFTGGSYDGKQLSNGLARVIGRCEELCFKQYIIRYSTLEAKYYIRTNEKHVSYTEFQNIRKATNWNPLLLHQFVLSHNDESLDKVLQYIEANISMSLSTGSLVGGIFETSSEPGVISYCTSIYVLKMAARNATVGELDIPIETVKSCYFVIENLIVIEEDHLVLAHPIFYRKFMLLLMNLQKKIDSDKYISSQAKRIIDGFAFEVEFLKLIPKHQLILRCSNHDHKEFLTSVKFNDINILKTAFVKKPIPGTLYHLRPKHPVIDMIGSCDGHLWLLQLSLQPYRSHKTKFKDLFEQFPTLEFGKNTIISYYAALFGTCEEKVVYIYVSPQQYKIPEISDDHVKKSKKYTIGIVNDTDFIKQVQDNLPFGGTAWS